MFTGHSLTGKYLAQARAVFSAVPESKRAAHNARTLQGGKVKQQRLKWIYTYFHVWAPFCSSADAIRKLHHHRHRRRRLRPRRPPLCRANPNTVEKGQSTTLTWQTSNATDVSIDGIGAVQPSGSQQVSPSDSTTYTLTAKGAGRNQTATARVTVTAPPPPPPPAPSPTEEELFITNVKDIYFDYDKADIRADQQTTLQGDIDFLKQHPDIHFTVEGHCDERGSTEYNLGTGRQPRQLGEECPGARWGQRRQHQDHQLRQGKTVLHRAHGRVLAAEPPWSFRLSEMMQPGAGRETASAPSFIWPGVVDACGILQDNCVQNALSCTMEIQACVWLVD